VFKASIQLLLLGLWRLAMLRVPTANISIRKLDQLKYIQSIIDGEAMQSKLAQQARLAALPAGQLLTPEER